MGEPDLVCFVDMDGYFIGEREGLDHMVGGEDDEVENGPHSALPPTDSPWSQGDGAYEDPADEAESPPAEQPSDDLSIFEGMLDGWATADRALVCATDRAHLWAILRRLALDFHLVMGLRVQKPRLLCHMGCGRVEAFLAFDDIPLRSQRCRCGHEWVIRYTDSPLPR